MTVLEPARPNATGESRRERIVVELEGCDPASLAALSSLIPQLGKAGRAQRVHVRRVSEHPSTTVEGRLPMPLLYGITLVVAACSILYELVLAQTLSALLGNTVLRYSITIGCYLGALGVGAMLCARRIVDPLRRLARVELGLCLLGGASVPLFYLFDGAQRLFYVQGSETAAPVLFVVSTHAVIVGIGVLSGFEIPLLLSLGEKAQPGSTNRVLGVDYFGSLLGSVAFPIFLLPELGLLETAFAVALLNALAALAVLGWLPGGRRPLSTAGVAAVLLLTWCTSRADRLEQHFLRKFYFYGEVEELSDLVESTTGRAVEHYQSPYQQIDLIRDRDSTQWFTDLLSSRRNRHPDLPRNLWLYLNGEFQFFSGGEEFYHEWFVHVPVQARGAPPSRALVLGGGDGMALREVLRYPAVREAVHVELDPEMLRLVREHPLLRKLAGPVHEDPRVELHNTDAFAWLRNGDSTFDLIVIDMPYPVDYNLSVVYSREFYSLVRHRLAPGGVVVLDAPDGWCGEDSLWPIYASTLHHAGFRTIVPMQSRVPFEDPRIQSRIANARRMKVAGGKKLLLGDEARAAMWDMMDEAWEGFPEHGFIVAFAEPRELDLDWTPMGIEHDALRPDLLAHAFESCAVPTQGGLVNSIFRPTLPELQLVSLRMP